MNCPNCKIVVLETVETNPPGGKRCPKCQKVFMSKPVENPKDPDFELWLKEKGIDRVDYYYCTPSCKKHYRNQYKMAKRAGWKPVENPPKPIELKWDGMSVLAREGLISPSGISVSVAKKKWHEIEKWLREDIQKMVESKSKGTVTVNPATHHVTGVNKETGKRHMVSRRMSLEDCKEFINEEPPHGGKGVWDKMRIIEWKTGKEVWSE